MKCPKSHVADDILDEEEFKDVARKRKRTQKKRERRRKRRHESDTTQQDDVQFGGPEIKKHCEGGEEDGCHGDVEERNGTKDDEPEDVEERSEDVDGTERTDQEMIESTSIPQQNTDGNSGVQSVEASDKINTDQKDVSMNGSDTNGDISQHNKKPAPTDSCLKPQYAGCHRAGFDAFMTGFAMATFVSQHGRVRISSSPDIPGVTDTFVEFYGLEELVNKLYLGGKDVPLQIAKSHFSKTSASHCEKMKKLGKL